MLYINEKLEFIKACRELDSENRKWLETFLNKCQYIDPYDDDAYIVDALMPYVHFIKQAHERSRNE